MPHWYTRWVEWLRAQPAPVKSQVAMIGAVVVTACIGLVWVTTLPARFSTLSGAGSSVGESVSDTLEQAPLAEGVFSEVPIDTEQQKDPAPQTEQEKLRSRIDALVGDIAREKKERDAGEAPQEETRATTTETPVRATPVSTPGAPVLIEAR